MAIKKTQKEHIEFISSTYPHIGNADYYMSTEYGDKLKGLKCTLSDSEVEAYLKELRGNGKYRKKVRAATKTLSLSYLAITLILAISSQTLPNPTITLGGLWAGGINIYLCSMMIFSLMYLGIGFGLEKSLEKRAKKESELEKTGLILDSEGKEVSLIWFFYHNLPFKLEEDRNLFLVEKYRKYNVPLSVALSNCKEGDKDIFQCLSQKLKVVKKELKDEANGKSLMYF